MKTKYYNFILLAITPIIISAFTCYNYPDYEDESHHYKIYFENCWDKPIVVWSTKDCYYLNNPCTMYVPFNKLWKYENQGEVIYPGRIDGDYIKHDGYYEDWFEEGDSLYIAVFDSDRNNENDSPRFLFSYLLSINDLQKVNFHLTYPPTENMKDLHMWPSYEDVMTDSHKTE